MSEQTTITPVQGIFDTEAPTRWLQQFPNAFQLPGGLWHLSATKELAERRQQQLTRSPEKWPMGMVVDLTSDRIVFHDWATADELALAQEVANLAVGDQPIRVKNSFGADLPLASVKTLFPATKPSSSIQSDILYQPVTEGALIKLVFASNARWFHVHTRGVAKAEWDDGKKAVLAELSATGRAQLQSILDAIDFSDVPDVPEHEVSPENILHLSVEWEDDEEFISMDEAKIPTQCEPLVACLREWHAILVSGERRDLFLRVER